MIFSSYFHIYILKCNWLSEQWPPPPPTSLIPAPHPPSHPDRSCGWRSTGTKVKFPRPTCRVVGRLGRHRQHHPLWWLIHISSLPCCCFYGMSESLWCSAGPVGVYARTWRAAVVLCFQVQKVSAVNLVRCAPEHMVCVHKERRMQWSGLDTVGWRTICTYVGAVWRRQFNGGGGGGAGARTLSCETLGHAQWPQTYHFFHQSSLHGYFPETLSDRNKSKNAWAFISGQV